MKYFVLALLAASIAADDKATKDAPLAKDGGAAGAGGPPPNLSSQYYDADGGYTPVAGFGDNEKPGPHTNTPHQRIITGPNHFAQISDEPVKCMWNKINGKCQDISGHANCVGDMPEVCPSLEASDVQMDYQNVYIPEEDMYLAIKTPVESYKAKADSLAEAKATALKQLYTMDAW